MQKAKAFWSKESGLLNDPGLLAHVDDSDPAGERRPEGDHAGTSLGGIDVLGSEKTGCHKHAERAVIPRDRTRMTAARAAVQSAVLFTDWCFISVACPSSFLRLFHKSIFPQKKGRFYKLTV